jgi:hypothetical protein
LMPDGSAAFPSITTGKPDLRSADCIDHLGLRRDEHGFQHVGSCCKASFEPSKIARRL